MIFSYKTWGKEKHELLEETLSVNLTISLDVVDATYIAYVLVLC